MLNLSLCFTEKHVTLECISCRVVLKSPTIPACKYNYHIFIQNCILSSMCIPTFSFYRGRWRRTGRKKVEEIGWKEKTTDELITDKIRGEVKETKLK